MKLLKKIYANPYVKAVLPSEPWMLAALVAVLLLSGFLVFLIIKRRKKAKQAQEETQVQEFLSPQSLVRVWHNFLKDIPGRFRRSILMYQPYIVMGESGTGKSSLIDNYSDWKSQANQFYPSHTQDELLQIYLGSRIVVQEVSAPLLHDISAPTRKALNKLWKKFKRRKDLNVVITLKGEDLLHKDPEDLKVQAQIIRGKVNVLSEILKRPVEVKIALTFMDMVQGFTQFSEFMNQNQIPFEIDVNSPHDLKNIEDFMIPYEDFIPNALVSVSSNDYLNMLAFYRSAPVLLAGLSRFISTLTDPDPFSAPPAISGIFFTGNTPVQDQPLSNPLQSKVAIKAVRKFHPLKRHQLAAAMIGIAGALFLAFSWYYKDKQVHRFMDDLDRITLESVGTGPKSPGVRKDVFGRALSLIADMEKLQQRQLDDRFLVDFFPDAENDINLKINQTIDQLQQDLVGKVFSPELVSLDLGANAYVRNLLVLSLIYSSNTNELGPFIRDNLDFWAKACNIPQDLIAGYINLFDNAWDKKIHIEGGLSIDSRTAQMLKNQSWVLFLKSIETMLKQSYISPRSLANLQKKASAYSREIDESLKADWLEKVHKLLIKESAQARDLMPLKAPAPKATLSGFKAFLSYFQGLAIATPDVKHMTLAQLFEQLDGMANFTYPDKQGFQFMVNGKSWYFTSSDFSLLMNKSGMAELLRAFQAHYGSHPGFCFFHAREEYEDLIVNISSDNNFYFSQRSAIDGRYTKNCYDADVKPMLKTLPELLDKLPVSKADKTRFSNFISRETQAYIDAYITAYETYYKGFRIHADSVGELRYILTQMSLPLSQFQEFLMVINDNISLELGSNAYFNIIKSRMRPLRFITLLMQSQADQYPEFEKYKAILRQIHEDLVAPVLPEEEAGKEGSALNRLKSFLSPEARISLDIFLDGPDSYMKMVRKWAISVGIPENWLYPFTEPVNQVYLLGRAQVEKTVAQTWHNLSQTYIDPVLSGFPFNRSSDTPVSPKALEVLAAPESRFWKGASGVVIPLYRKDSNGEWVPRHFGKSQLNFPGDIADRLNFVTRLSKTFFDETGKPKPLVFEVKPHPLPLAEKDLIYVVLTYMRFGKNTVFGFNQKPVWHQFKIDWWKEVETAVGAEFMEDVNKSDKLYAQASIPAGIWSFYRLLAKADDKSEAGTWMWDLESPGQVQWKRAISFSIKENPWDMLKVIQY